LVSIEEAEMEISRQNGIAGAIFPRNLANFLNPRFGRIPQSAELRLDRENRLSGQDIVTLSTQDWQDLWTRKQRFMLQFARQGNKVLYVETQFHWVTYARRFRKQWRRIYLFLLGPRVMEPNLFIFTPPLLLPAFQIFPKIAAINNFFLAFIIKRAMKRTGMESPLLWLYSHYNQPLIKKLGCKRALYECVDEFSGAMGLIRADVVMGQEKATLESVDVAIVTAPGLKSSKVSYNRNIHVVPNAANVGHFIRAERATMSEPADLTPIPHPRLIFVGGIAYWVDLDLIRHLARSRPAWQIVMVGPVMVGLGNLEKLENVHFQGRKSYDELPSYLAWSDVALNPYKVDSVAQNCSPLKLYEYMAAGLPVVSTDMPESRKFPSLIMVAEDYDEFVLAAEKVLAWPPHVRHEYSRLARQESQKHSWESRFLEVERIAREVIK